MSNDLKPCPFCGQEAPGLHLMTVQATHMTSKRHAYFCESCQCCGPEGDTVEEARELWDTRPSLWRLTKTAPRDGTEVLILIEGKRQAVAHWDEDSWWSTSHDTRILTSCITHWQPLQPLPEPQE